MYRLEKLRLASALAIWSFLGFAHPAYPDEQEASLQVELAPVVMRAEDAQDLGTMTSLLGSRVSLRGGYGVSDHLAIELGVAGIWGTGSIPDQMHNSRTGSLAQDELALRATVGGTVRLGVRWIPTLTAHVGYQYRRFTRAVLVDDSGTEIDDPLPTSGMSDIVVLLGAGLEYRFGARWVAGGSVQVVHAFSLDGDSFDSLEVPLWVARYWYPGW